MGERDESVVDSAKNCVYHVDSIYYSKTKKIASDRNILSMMSDAPSLAWIICFWIFFAWNTLFVPVALYYLYIYVKHRDKAFFRPRMSNATSMMVCWTLVSMIQRIHDGFIGTGYIPNDHVINSLFNFLQLYPVFSFYIYKLSTVY